MAAEAVRISRRSHYVWLAKDTDYAAAFRLAREWAHDSLRDEAVRRAMGYDAPMYRRGKLVGTKRIYSDRLLIALLEEMEQFKNCNEAGRLDTFHMTSQPAIELAKLTEEELAQLKTLSDKLGERAGRVKANAPVSGGILSLGSNSC